MHPCPYCHKHIHDTHALCPHHAHTLTHTLTTWATLQPALTDALAGLTRHTDQGRRGGRQRRDAANPALLDLKNEIDDTITAWATNYGHTTTSAENAAAWLTHHAPHIIRDHADAAECIDELDDALKRLTHALNPPGPTTTGRTCPHCGHTTKTTTTPHRTCPNCHATITPDSIATTLRDRAPSLWLTTNALTDYVEIVTGTHTTPDRVRHRALYHHVRRDSRGRWSAADYLHTLTP